MSLQKATWQKYLLHLLFFIFESESLAIVIRGEMKSKSFRENLHPKLSLRQMLHALLLATCFSAVRYSFLQLPHALSGTVLYPQLLLYSLYLTSVFIKFITSASSIDSFSSHFSFFPFSYFEGGREREDAFHSVALCFINSNMLKSISLQLGTSPCV